MTVREKLTQEIQKSSDSVLEKVLDFLLFLKSQNNEVQVQSNSFQNSHEQNAAQEAPSERPIWQLFEEVADNLPEEILADLPTDGSNHHDHYLYGNPKR
ncbi:MAG: hypothetical protein N5P05_002554 [Chroococcopsis gigantea SAG 12.99]|jgi:hypothetical protein|nr:hypothetical protein [Chlorogloea purpurea SAG 13.99]MDV3000948.1 hypothetical protein [Chroococcopsis gigantea SAG 12.99]